MNSKRLWATTFFALSALGPRLPGACAQTQTMAVCRAGWSWNENSLGQDPCAISSILDAACRGSTTYTIPSINSSQNYLPPQANSAFDLTCDCDTVMYSLYMACTTCQGGAVYPWTSWIAQCQTVYVMQYPHEVAQGTAIPKWAFYNVTSLPNETYSDAVASSVGPNPEATPTPITTISLSSTHTGTTSSETSPGSGGSIPTSTGDNSSSSKTNTGAIAGGVVGGVVALGILSAVAVFFIRRRRQGGGNQPLPPISHAPVAEYHNPQPTSPAFSHTGTNLPYTNSYYNPADPTTFPPPIGDGQSSYSYGTPHGPPSPGQGRYSGAPEI